MKTVQSSEAALQALVVEDHEMVGEMLAQLLQEAGFEVVGVVGKAEQAWALVNAHKPSLVLCDIRLGEGATGIDLTRKITSAFPDTRVVMVSAENDGRLVQKAYAAGAAGYVSKVASGPELIQTVADAMAGVTGAADRYTYRKLVESLQKNRVADSQSILTPRELEVVRLMAQGITSTVALAEKLVISPHSVRSHIENCRKKLGVTSRAAIVAQAYRLNLIEVGEL